MKVDDLRKAFGYISFINFRNYILYDNLELWDEITKESIYFNSLEEAFSYKFPDGKTIEDVLEGIEIVYNYEGGRGATSPKEMGGGFGHAPRGGGGEIGKTLFPSEFNKQGRFSNQENAIKEFETKYKDADKEYGISIDSNGFVYRHVSGGATSVAINAAGENHMIVHNHPSGGAFSDSDLLSTAKDKNAKGIIASGSNTKSRERYTFIKNKNFDSNGFSKAIKSAKWPTKYNYDDGASWWLKKNQKKYGYEFSRIKI